jgi:cytoskeletal protein CcmA (bactofilin family)
MSARNSIVLPTSGKYDNHLNAGATIKGKFEFSGTALIEGIIYGDVESFGKLSDAVVISPNGKVFGSIRCKAVSISGTVVGDIYASHINLEANSMVQGDVFYETLGIDAQAVINGRLMQTSIEELQEASVNLLPAPEQPSTIWSAQDYSSESVSYSDGNQASDYDPSANLQDQSPNAPAPQFQFNSNYTPKRVWGKR